MNITVNQRFGKLVAVSHTIQDGRSAWVCRCDCGEMRVVRSYRLRTNGAKTCGCAKNVTHGKSKTRTYNIWHAMRQRCGNPRNTNYKDYGGRGIKVCPEWQDSFEQFLADMGEAPGVMELERKDNNAGYSKANCIWATHADQMKNRRSNGGWRKKWKRLEPERSHMIATLLGVKRVIVHYDL